MSDSLVRKPRARLTSRHEAEILALRHLPRPDIARQLGLSYSTVDGVLRRLKLAPIYAEKKPRRAYTPADFDYLRQQAHLGAAQLAQDLGRTLGSLHYAARRAGIVFGPARTRKPFLPHEIAFVARNLDQTSAHLARVLKRSQGSVYRLKQSLLSRKAS